VTWFTEGIQVETRLFHSDSSDPGSVSYGQKTDDGGERIKEVEGQRQTAISSRKARTPLPTAVFACGNTRIATCVGPL